MAVSAPTGSQSHETNGALRDAEEDEDGDEDLDRPLSLPRRMDTEMGGRLQASGLELGQLQRRATVPVPANSVIGRPNVQQVYQAGHMA